MPPYQTASCAQTDTSASRSALLLYVVSGGVYCILVPWFDDRYSYYSDEYDDNTMNTLYNIEVRVLSVGQLFDDVATALLLVTLVEIGNGFLYILSQTRTGLQKGLRWGTISVAGIIVVLAIAHLGQTNTTWGKYFDYQAGNGDGQYFALGSFDRDLKTVRQLSGAVVILFFVMTLPLIAFASYVVHRVKNIPLLRSVSSSDPAMAVAMCLQTDLTCTSRPLSSLSRLSSSSSGSPGSLRMWRHGFSSMIQWASRSQSA